MTSTAEQATQDQTNTQEADSFAAREKKRAEESKKALDEESARVRESWRSQWEQEKVSSFVTPQTLNMFVNMWKGADLTAVEFAAGISNIVNVKQDERAPHVHLLTSKFGNEFAYINNGGQEFIGLTTRQAKKTQLDEKAADDIALTAFARGWKNVTVSGTDAEKDMLWLAAQKYGLAVTNHIPTNPDLLNAYKNGPDAGEAAAGMGAGTTMPVKVETSPVVVQPRSRFQQEDIVDAEFTDVVEPDTKFAKKIEGPAKPLLLEGPKNNPPAP